MRILTMAHQNPSIVLLLVDVFFVGLVNILMEREKDVRVLKFGIPMKQDNARKRT